ncbi:hypothetical protein [Rhizobium binae]|uniref:hypothetical protein n=1 Tax=Rhizobium binae TaxID=1138190 RepID=UPI001C83F101|nr:hypothetical protein [Rhizobium binae]MBX4936797.1 hypothetical protein [Rhizobium binae]MBX4943122.1 hypothetical protein [Rhizobium binae]MBX4978728.1 hypothetical protein [Rhizobium binae]
MRVLVLTLVRLGPALVYAIGAVFAASMLLLAMYPSRPFAWELYLTMLPVLRLPLMLLSVVGMGAWDLLAVFTSLVIFGVYLSFHPKRFLRARFVHAHVALLGLVLANAAASTAEAGRVEASMPGYVDWSLPLPTALLGTALIIWAALACVSTHAEIIRRILVRASIHRLLTHRASLH